MAQNTSFVSEQQVTQWLHHALGQIPSETELAQCLQHIEFLEPAPGKPFWQSVDAIPGIYIVLGGKVRLLNADDDLIASLEDG